MVVESRITGAAKRRRWNKVAAIEAAWSIARLVIYVSREGSSQLQQVLIKAFSITMLLAAACGPPVYAVNMNVFNKRG